MPTTRPGRPAGAGERQLRSMPPPPAGTLALDQHLVIPDSGHWVAEQAPEELLAALTAFLAPYRAGVPA
jgi:pimeloyl-ACP methyl ester carboxylesterase